ncbi:tetratricopeptide repeat protein [Martelella limonii]|uniref:tetratricopeptide repeat protein n=1 Tax=Martelella limonii TaxID=1647649 RepID=UPI00157FF4CD|nr:tetratricopeptide repeat protein [Martelella limonii]
MKIRLLARTAVVAVFCLSAEFAAAADLPVIDFRPPDIAAAKVCADRKSDDALVLQWSNWDGRELPGGVESRDLDRELMRLRNIDANKYFDTIKSAYDLRRQEDPYYDRAAYLLDVVALYEAAERFDDLKNTGFVGELETIGPSASPATVNFLADLYLQGKAVPQDIERGMQRKLQAAYNGDPDAVLYLAEKTGKGEDVPGWDMEPELAFTLGYSSLLGNLDNAVCGRIRRIARAFEKGDVIAQDHVLAEAWYRFAADLGDGQAAWNTARYHLSGEGIDKDNTKLLHYLQEAYDAGIVPAKLQMARLYEDGILVPVDLGRAMAIYDELAADGEREGFAGATRLLARRGLETPEDRQKYHDRLVALTRFPEAPGWAFSRLGEWTLDEEGPWQGQAESRQLFEAAAARGDGDGKLELARLYLRDGDEGDRKKAVEMLQALIADEGRIAAVDALKNALLCANPAGPEPGKWEKWKQLEREAGPQLPEGVTAEALSDNADALAGLQTAALSGSTQAAGDVAALLARLHPDRFEDVLEHWTTAMRDKPGGAAKVLSSAYQAATTDDQRRLVVTDLQVLAKTGDPAATAALADILIGEAADRPAALDEATALVEAAAGPIEGETLWRLDEAYRAAGKGRYDPPAALLAEIAGSGDFDALLFAASRADDDKDRALFYARAEMVMPCDLNALARKAQYALNAGQPEEADEALDVALALSPEEGWQQVKLADIYTTLGSIADRKEAFRLYAAARDQGYDPAARRLLDWYSDPDSRFYQEDEHATLLIEELEKASPAELSGLANRVKHAPAAVKDKVFSAFDMASAYRKAAEAGDPVAMRELSTILRGGKGLEADADEAASWLQKAAEAGDSEAMLQLAQAYAFGAGVEQSAEKASMWLKSAADAGNEAAGRLLSGLKTN